MSILILYYLVVVILFLICYRIDNINIQVVCIIIIILLFQEIQFILSVTFNQNKKVSFNEKIDIMQFNDTEFFNLEKNDEYDDILITSKIYDKTTMNSYKKYANNLKNVKDYDYNYGYSIINNNTNGATSFDTY